MGFCIWTHCNELFHWVFPFELHAMALYKELLHLNSPMGFFNGPLHLNSPLKLPIWTLRRSIWGFQCRSPFELLKLPIGVSHWSFSLEPSIGASLWSFPFELSNRLPQQASSIGLCIWTLHCRFPLELTVEASHWNFPLVHLNFSLHSSPPFEASNAFIWTFKFSVSFLNFSLKPACDRGFFKRTSFWPFQIRRKFKNKIF